MKLTEELRDTYRPEVISVLFVGESPPRADRFFYDDERPSKLRKFTEQAMRAALGDRIGPDFLRSFQRLGCYLDDLCLEPINDIKHAATRRAARKSCEPGLAERLRDTQPAVVVGIGIGCSVNFTRATQEAGIAPPIEILPFPARARDEDRYLHDLEALIGRLEHERVLLD